MPLWEPSITGRKAKGYNHTHTCTVYAVYSAMACIKAHLCLS